MTEQEAVTIAKKFVTLNNIEHEGVQKVFYLPVSAYEVVPPGLNDSWVIHFKSPPVQEDEFDLLLSGEQVIIVRVDTKTKEASIMSQL